MQAERRPNKTTSKKPGPLQINYEALKNVTKYENYYKLDIWNFLQTWVSRLTSKENFNEIVIFLSLCLFYEKTGTYRQGTVQLLTAT
jgi:hypothetical protein